MTVGDNPYITANNTAGIGLQRWTDGNVYIDFKTVTGGGIYFRSGSGAETGYTRFWMTVDPRTGSVGIGTTTPQHLLHVAGTIGAEEVIVSSTGADYVFEPGYRLAPLGEVADYIQVNHHLPEIPSAAEMQGKGLGLGDMQAKLLAKIEAEKDNQALRERIARLEAKSPEPEPQRDAKEVPLGPFSGRPAR